jgi:hypothetical protein
MLWANVKAVIFEEFRRRLTFLHPRKRTSANHASQILTSKPG